MMNKNKLMAGAMALTMLTAVTTQFGASAADYYFHSDFETGNEWTARGAADVERTRDVAAKGDYSLSISNRTDSWNGASMNLGTEFQAGQTYSFSVKVMHKGTGSEHFKLTLQYSTTTGGNAGGWGGIGGINNTQYDAIAEADVPAGSWATLSNTAYTIPEGASNLVIYVETEGSTTAFYMDEAYGAAAGADITDGPGGTEFILGDVNLDRTISKQDVDMMIQFLTAQNLMQPVRTECMDMDGNGHVDARDLSLLKHLVANPPATTTSTTVTTTTTPSTTSTTVTTGGGQGGNNSNIMEEVRKNMTRDVPANIKNHADTGKTEKISYPSKIAGMNKPAYVWTPPGYSTDKKYPVMLMNHGVGGDENGMLGADWAVRQMLSGLIESGEAVPCIVVFTQMYTCPGVNGSPPGMQFDQPTMDHYDDFCEDATDSLLPYVYEHYSCATGRENTATAGFSMGGRESLYLGMRRPDVFGYICASSPAPGIFPTRDSFMTHAGSPNGNGGRYTQDDIKITPDPILCLIAGGTNDFVVGNYPEDYHNLFTQHGTDHIWQSVPGGGHDSGVGCPLFYNFFRGVFK